MASPSFAAYFPKGFLPPRPVAFDIVIQCSKCLKDWRRSPRDGCWRHDSVTSIALHAYLGDWCPFKSIEPFVSKVVRPG